MNKEQLQKEYQNGRRDFSNLDLSGLDLTDINLEGANLTGTDLSGTNLRSVNFTGANLTGANLSGASLFLANLTTANLTETNLSDACLCLADLTNANLTNANLTNVDFEYTKFRGANLQGIQFEGTSFFSANLVDTKNIPSPTLSPLFVPTDHPDIDLANSIRSVTEGLHCGSETDYPYDIFLWNTVIRGEFTLEKLLKEMGHLKLTNLQDIQQVDSDTKQLTRYYQVLLDKIQAQLSEIEIYQFETRYMRSCNSARSYIIIGRTAVSDWFGTMITSCYPDWNDGAMIKVEHIKLISAVEEVGAEIEKLSDGKWIDRLIWSLADDRDIVLQKLLSVTDSFKVQGVEYCNYVTQEDDYEDYKEEDMDDEDKINKKKREVLAQLVLNNLSNIRVYFVGEVDMELYLIGETKNQDWLGIHTGLVWT
jgi:hypothetical protein